MTIKEAQALLSIAPRDTQPSRVNKSLTRQQVTEIIDCGFSPRCMNRWRPEQLDDLYELRVYQAACDRRRPSDQAKATARIAAGLENGGAK